MICFNCCYIFLSLCNVLFWIFSVRFVSFVGKHYNVVVFMITDSQFTTCCGYRAIKRKKEEKKEMNELMNSQDLLNYRIVYLERNMTEE